MTSVAAHPCATQTQPTQSIPHFVEARASADATTPVAGSIVDTGISRVAADMARTVGSPASLLAAWLLVGLITAGGALGCGALAAFPRRVGGRYVGLRESMGSLMGSLRRWARLVPSRSVSCPA